MTFARLIAVFSILLSTFSSAKENDNIVLLIGIDAFKHDLLEQYQLPHLSRLASQGVSTEGLIPVMPSKTFANFYAMATGVYPQSNGVLGNNTFDREQFKIYGHQDVPNEGYFLGEPIWITAEEQGIVAANMFWVGSESPYQGRKSSYWYAYDGSIPNRKRVNQVLEWLDMPTAKRPGFITLYFSDLDSASHTWGVNSKQREHAAKAIDHQIGYLLSELDKRQLDNLHIIVVGDHGMADLSPQRVINIDKLMDMEFVAMDKIDRQKPWVISPQLTGHNKGNAVAVLAYTDSKATTEKVYKQLVGSHPNMTVYKYPDFPAHYHLEHPTRYPDLLLVPDTGWLISKTHVPFSKTYNATHGFDNHDPEMHANFIGYGKRFNQAKKLPAFENTNIYCIAAGILGLDWQQKDCSKNVVNSALK